MKHLIASSLLLLISMAVSAQIKHTAKAETGYLSFFTHRYQLDPGPDWKGYHLHENQNGIDLSLINGLSFLKTKAFAGLGIGYLNFEGTNGLSVFTDLEYLPLGTRLTPLINANMGYSHIWNQYSGGTGSVMGELTLGMSYQLSKRYDIYVKSGLLLTQQSTLFPIKIGLRLT